MDASTILNNSFIKKAVNEMPADAASTFMVNGELSFIFKMGYKTIRRLRGEIPIRFEHQLGLYSSGAVILGQVVFFPNSEGQFQFPHFYNVASGGDYSILNTLAKQDVIRLFFYDNLNRFQLSKTAYRNKGQSSLSRLIAVAVEHNFTLPNTDFSTAKAAMIAELRNPGVPDCVYGQL